MNILVLACICLALLTACFIALIRTLFSRVDKSGSYAEWFVDFSIETYRPMERLLNEEDYVFLSQQPGYNSSICQELRAERKKIFRDYLRNLVQDFHRLVHVANLMMVYSGEDRIEMANKISKLRFALYCAVIRAEISLLLPGLPVSAGTLIGALESMRQNVQNLAPRRQSLWAGSAINF